MRPIALAFAALAIGLVVAASPARAGIRTDNGSLQNPNSITIIQTQASQAPAVAGREG
ncbi:hypothetical protein [Plastoroseomonas arctica]|uniref:Uncharacterized protein n=1 Tax=Plastoroseomonas arctica TaxID=1509237 RepID=A0AAF1JZQ3_9PROT|nr:hypothetical protein [Plastoroseomonas arctica]MBR0657025.1 hypothetical protein [Plastoroseomonas arctica]